MNGASTVRRSKVPSERGVHISEDNGRRVESESEPEAESEPEPEAEAEPESEAEPEAEAESGAEPEAEAEQIDRRRVHIAAHPVRLSNNDPLRSLDDRRDRLTPVAPAP